MLTTASHARLASAAAGRQPTLGAGRAAAPRRLHLAVCAVAAPVKEEETLALSQELEAERQRRAAEVAKLRTDREVQLEEQVGAVGGGCTREGWRQQIIVLCWW